jgi:hypothetical protein
MNLKFSRKAAKGKYRVELAQDMSETWFAQNIGVLESALQNLTQALGYERREFK